MTEKPLAFLSLIKVLETAVGHRTRYALLDPFPCITVKDGKPAIITIQNAGTIIAQHVGLGDLTFIISVTTQEPTTAGHIELRYGSPEVFVEISRDICAHKDAVLATLCHEVSHKFLHVHGVRHGTMQVEQEFLTDVAAVYLGMGKIMLNGCECQSSHTETVGDRTTTTSQTLRTGYISRECFAFVYRLVCEMRGIPAPQFLSGLSEPARQAVLNSEQANGDWFMPEYHTPEGIERLGKDLRETILDSQDRAAERDHTLRKVSRTIEELRSCLHDSHKLLFQAERRIVELLEPKDNPHLRYLDCIEARESVADLASASKRTVEHLRPGWDRIGDMAKAMPLQPEADALEVVECPIDQTKLRVPSGRKRLLVTCSTCKYKFIVNTAQGVKGTSTVIRGDRQQSGLWKSLKAVFGRR